MMSVFEQNDFRGMALRGTAQDNPYTSRMEINCESEEGSLNRIKGREPYLTTQLHCPAIYFEDNNVFAACYDGLGKPVNLPYSTATFETSVCFKWDDANISTEGIVDGTAKNIYGHFDTASGCYAPFYIRAKNTGTTNAWHIETDIATSSAYDPYPYGRALFSTLTLSSGAWYWVRVKCPTLSTTTVDTFINGSTVAAESLTANHTLRSAMAAVGVCQPMIAGSINEGYRHFSNSSIAYVAAGPVNSNPEPWVCKIARGQSGDPDISFAIQDPTDSAFIAKIGTAASSSYSWNFVPNRNLTTASCSKATHILDATGVVVSDKNQYTLSISNDTLFKSRTVFMFLLDIQGKTSDLIRSEDNTFKIKVRNDDEAVNTSYWFYSIMNPPSPTSTLASSDYARNVVISANISSNGTLSNRWVAVEYFPDSSASVSNVNMFYYSAATWNSMFPSTTHARSLGITPPESTRYVIGPSQQGDTKIYDFRVVVGDENWKANHTPSITNQDGLVTWLNSNTSAALIGQNNIKFFSTKNSNGLAEQVIAVSDRVDGKFRYRIDPGSYKQKMTGCPYLKNAFCASVDDLVDNGNGDVRGVTNSYYFETKNGVQTSYPISVSRSKNRNKVFGVGSNVFIANGSEINIVGTKTRNTSTPIPIVVCVPCNISEASSRLANRGFLAANAIFKVKTTIYNPDTGDESNAYGPFSFINGATVGGFIFETNVSSPVDLRALEVRHYRYLVGDGTYHLDGSSKLNVYIVSPYGSWLSDYRHYYRAMFTFTLSDADLLLQPALEESDYHTPDSTHTTIYNNRGWYVDKYNPSRIYYSKQYYVGTVPTTNLLWTDEGITGDILGTLPGFGGLLLLKERSIWAVSPFSTDEEATCGQIIPNIGCVSGDAAVFVDGVLYWAATEGIFIYDGTTTTNVTKDINGLQKMVWDHDPRGTRAMYDGDNFKVVFWNDGSCISLDVRNGAIRLGASNDRCVASVSSITYSGPAYGGVGGVFKESISNRGGLGTDGGMPRLNDDFSAGTQQAFNTATNALVAAQYQWYAVNGDNASVFDVNTTNNGQLTLQADGAAAHMFSAGAANGIAAVRRLHGDFDVMAKPFLITNSTGNTGIICFGSASAGNFVAVEMSGDSPYYIKSRSNSGVVTNSLDIATVTTQTNEFRLKRVGNVITPYLYSASAWVSGVPVSLVLGDPVYVGIVLNAGAASVVASRWSWLYNTPDFDSSVDSNSATYGPVSVTASGYTSALNWNWTDGNLGSGSKRVGSIFPLWTDKGTWLDGWSLVGREIYHWNDERNNIWSTILHAVEAGTSGVYYFITKQTDLDEFFICKRPYYYRGQNIYYGKRADAKKFERIEIITGEGLGGGSADVRFASQLHGETSEMTASGSMTFTASVNNSLPIRLRGNYGYIEIEGYSPLNVSDVKLMRVTYKPTRPRGRLA